MPRYRYVGMSDEVSMSKEDFTRHDVDDQDGVLFNADNNKTAELSESAANMLLSQGFSIMTEEDYNSFLETKRQEMAEEAPTIDSSTVTPPAPTAAEMAALANKPAPVPERPGSDATRDDLANYAWTHYMIPVDTDQHHMTKAEINKALDKAEKERAKADEAAAEADQTPDQPVSPEAVTPEGNTGTVNTT